MSTIGCSRGEGARTLSRSVLGRIVYSVLARASVPIAVGRNFITRFLRPRGLQYLSAEFLMYRPYAEVTKALLSRLHSSWMSCLPDRAAMTIPVEGAVHWPTT